MRSKERTKLEAWWLHAHLWMGSPEEILSVLPNYVEELLADVKAKTDKELKSWAQERDLI